MLVKKLKIIFITLIFIITFIAYNYLSKEGFKGTERRLNLLVVMIPICVILGIILAIFEKIEKQTKYERRKNKK